MKRTLKESVISINNMIGRIDHPTIVEGPGDEEKSVEGKSNTKIKHVAVPLKPNIQWDLEKQIMSYITDNRDAAELKSALFKKVPKLNLGPSSKLGAGIATLNNVVDDFKMSPLGKSPLSGKMDLGKKFMVKIKHNGKFLNFPVNLEADVTLIQNVQGILNVTKGLKFGGANVKATVPIEYTDKKRSQLSKAKQI